MTDSTAYGMKEQIPILMKGQPAHVMNQINMYGMTGPISLIQKQKQRPLKERNVHLAPRKYRKKKGHWIMNRCIPQIAENTGAAMILIAIHLQGYPTLKQDCSLVRRNMRYRIIQTKLHRMTSPETKSLVVHIMRQEDQHMTGRRSVYLMTELITIELGLYTIKERLSARNQKHVKMNVSFKNNMHVMSLRQTFSISTPTHVKVTRRLVRKSKPKNKMTV